MKRLMILISLVLSVPVFATYYEITSGYTPGLPLDNSDTLLMTGGGMGLLTLEYQSSATIEDTSALAEGSGGIWQIDIANDSSLYMSGGQVNMITIGNGDATAILTGGTITGIFSYQSAWQWQYFPEPPVLIWNPHITIVYSGVLPTVQNINGYNVLTGLWGNGAGFSIYLPNITGYSPAIENIQFQLIPEPATLLLVGLGSLFIRRK